MSARLGSMSTRRSPATAARPGQMRPAIPSELSSPRALEAIAITIGVRARPMVRTPASSSRPEKRRPIAGPAKSMAPARNQRIVARREGFG